MATRIAVAGAAGRMGREIIALASAGDRWQISAAVESTRSIALGRDAGELAGRSAMGCIISDRLDADYDVLIDFSSPAGTDTWLSQCVRRGRPMVIGVTGHDSAQMKAVESAARRIAVLRAANMSLGANLLMRIAQECAAVLMDYDVEIVETHHREKKDAPSGTALQLKDAVLAGRGAAGDVVCGRAGQTGPRPKGQIGIHSLRAGSVIGEHEVQFTNAAETIALRHVAHSRETFARGALAAAAWLVGRPAGLYSMQDVLRPKDVRPDSARPA